MTDLEITKLCAEAMGIELVPYDVLDHSKGYHDGRVNRYDPLHDDAQAMDLVKKFHIRIDRTRGIPEKWGVFSMPNYADVTIDADLNRAICLCVAQMQATK